ncbi:MAG: hypothetical protein KY475_07700 [Planctomycetes bacterium]|nr:hypothetical protein [Planctomycetota bacterium]
MVASADAPTPHESFYWRLGSGANAQWVVRHGDWNLLGNPRDTSNTAPLAAADKLFLVNLAEDPAEMRNLAAANRAVVARLQEMQHDFEQGIQSQIDQRRER